MNVLRTRVAAVAGLAVLTLVASATVGRPQGSLALLTDAASAAAGLASGAIFPGERVTTAFHLIDRSSGSDVDASSPFAFPSDGLVATTAAWAAGFSSDRYLEFDLNASLPGGLVVSSASFAFHFSSNSAVGVTCHWFEVRRISTGAVVATHGSASVPVACATGATLLASTVPIPAVDTTGLANDLRIRVFGSDSAADGMRIDRTTVAGETAYAAFELYPVTFRDAADSTPAVVPWELAGP